jgi:hypothetical protein
MRISLGILASATVIFLSGAIGLVGTWALSAGAALMLVGAVAAAVAMEAREPVFTPLPSPVRTRQ